MGERETIKVPKSMVRVHPVSLLFLQKGENGCLSNNLTYCYAIRIRYDAYFYGNNRSYEVVQRYQRAWLLHIHRNPHHWQHWILIHDDMEDGELETVLEMPYDYIIEMICDWWSFSWQSGNLYEIFKWYEEHSKYIKLAQTTKITVEYILDNMKKKLQALQYADQSAMQPGA